MSFVVLCALLPEAVAARIGLRRARPARVEPGDRAPAPVGAHPAAAAAPSGGRVRLVGMGPVRARKAASRLASVLPDGLPVVVLGVGGALGPGCSPGDLVVADSIGTAEDSGEGLAVTRPPVALDARSSAFSDQVTAALSDRFPSTRQAPLLSAGRTAKGPERLVLGAGGAVICDTESYWLNRLADRHPFAVVRSIVDTPERELVSTQTLTGGLQGLRTLAEAAAVIARLLDKEPATQTA